MLTSMYQSLVNTEGRKLPTEIRSLYKLRSYADDGCDFHFRVAYERTILVSIKEL